MSTAEARSRHGEPAGPSSSPTEDAAAALARGLHDGAHYLPSQGPIETFIHHNTLHAFEDLEFHTALAASAKIVGANSYLSEREFREAHSRGRITDRDLDDAIALRGVLAGRDTTSPDPFCNRAAILRACLLHDLDPEPIPRIRWRFSEDRALGEPGDAARWPACLDAVHRIGRGDAPDLRGEARGVLASVGERTHRDIALAMTSIDIAQAVDRWMVRDVAAHLDEGIAIDAHPLSHTGLFAGWRARKRAGKRHLAGIPANVEIPTDPVQAALLALDNLGVPVDRYEAYITRLLQHLPGWAGMIHWRETHPEYRPELPPVGLVDFVAIRLLGEWSELNLLCRATWGCEARHMIAWLEDRPEETTLRHALFDGRLMEKAARLARRVLLRRPDRREADAKRIVEAAMCIDDGPELGRAWQLHRLTRVLGIHGDELRCTPLPKIAGLLATLDELGPAVRVPVWQEAYEQHYRDQILEALHDNRAHRRARTGRPSFQVVTCIDDREEGFRRHLEEIEPSCETFGTGGFFGVPIAFLGRGETELSSLCPLGVQPMHRVLEVPTDDRPALARRFDRGHAAVRRWRGHWREILGHGWASILGAYTAGFFAWLWIIGELVFPRQFARVVRPLRKLVLPDHPTSFVTDESCDASHAIAGFSLREQVERTSSTLQNLGLVRDFSPLVCVLGHGSRSKNNPHLSAYDCGACGGRHGGPNARLFCQMANSPAVRAGLRAMGIEIPDDTWFIGGEHNTGNEDITWSDLSRLPAARTGDFTRAAAALDRARAMSAHERCRKLEHAPDDCTPDEALRHVQERSLDPSQARPELGHVTNAACVFGRRRLTRGVFFDRRMFLVSYDPTIDHEGEIIERLLMALGPVGAGISLEYYFSRVDVQRYGAGTKLPHNVVGLIGVMDGWSSDLRTGLPQQMVEIHEPMRLLVVIESTPRIIGDILARQPMLRTLVDNGWIRVTLVDPDDGTARNYVPGTGFVEWKSRDHVLPVVLDSAAWYRGTLDFLPPARIETPARIGERREGTR